METIGGIGDISRIGAIGDLRVIGVVSHIGVISHIGAIGAIGVIIGSDHSPITPISSDHLRPLRALRSLRTTPISSDHLRSPPITPTTPTSSDHSDLPDNHYICLIDHSLLKRPMDKHFLPHYGNYRQLKAYQVTEIIYDITYHFAHHFLSKWDRTVDQMIQAARSGKQNIAEGNMAATTSLETEIRLTNVAKSSLGELLLDYEDYLRTRQLSQWGPEHERYQAMRDYAKSDAFKSNYTDLLPKLSDEVLCNLAITLIHQADYLLRRLIEHQEKRFTEEGGIRERMSNVRRQYRSRK